MAGLTLVADAVLRGNSRSKPQPDWRKMRHGRLFRMNRDGCKTTAYILRHDESGSGREKGVDIRIALDLIRLTLNQKMDVAQVFSKDQDFAEVASELRLTNKKNWLFCGDCFGVSEKRTCLQ